jgi:hypothetical protein
MLASKTLRRLVTALLVAAPLLTSGCLIQSEIQGRYVEDQSGCRSNAEDNITYYEKPGMSPKDRNNQLVSLFAKCMAKKGWQVAKPKVARGPNTDGPHGPLDPYGSNAATAAAARSTTTTTTTTTQPSRPAYAPRQAPTQAPVGQRAVETQTTPLSPSGSMPPLAQPTENAPSYYQPGRGYYAPQAKPYGSGGRNF